MTIVGDLIDQFMKHRPGDDRCPCDSCTIGGIFGGKYGVEVDRSIRPSVFGAYLVTSDKIPTMMPQMNASILDLPDEHEWRIRVYRLDDRWACELRNRRKPVMRALFADFAHALEHAVNAVRDGWFMGYPRTADQEWM